MSRNSETLQETALWKAYQNKLPGSSERNKWVKQVYENAVIYLKDVRKVFKNYTLHDETHIINVLDAMGGLLGDCIEKLTIGEMELLILAASLHDLGMVYTDEEIERCLEQENACKKFLMENRPDLLGCNSKDWTNDLQQWYLRTLHPFRIWDVLQNEGWIEIMDCCPIEIVSRQCIIAVCQAHGEKPDLIRVNSSLDYQPASDVDPLFCAILLRLADLLDFDDTRAPQILYNYAKWNEKSREEWDKHQASAGFTYPASPSLSGLPYKARCKNPEIEHAIREFLSWIDDELNNALRLEKYCKEGWRREFPFPREILCNEIVSDGYMSGDFCLTMEQEQILNLMMGENLYSNRDVFVRELLQNAIDAVLCRGEMDDSFIPEKSRIDFWEWTDKDGKLWFRIDDEGIGMTCGMLQRYFLKVGNSYYVSKELERDMREHRQIEDYQGISRFGIGFLSCFLCGDYAEVSTLYWDSNKNRKEESVPEASIITNYGLRLQVTGLKGYFTLKNQAKNHKADNFPTPGFYNAGKQNRIKQHDYRTKPGTSVAICLNPGKLGALNLRETVEKYLCGARIPVYYNNEPVGRTYQEAMQIVHEKEGKWIYELTPKLKKEFDERFPAIRGQYPKLKVEVISLDNEIGKALLDLSGVLIKYELQFDKIPEREINGQRYIVAADVNCDFRSPEISLISKSSIINDYPFLDRERIQWSDLKREYGVKETEALGAKLKLLTSCPNTGEQLGEVWNPFSRKINIPEVWVAYHNYYNENEMSFNTFECEIPDIYTIFKNNRISDITYAYKGVTAGVDDYGIRIANNCCSLLLLLDGKYKPDVKISRSEVVGLPLEVLLVISVIANKYGILDDIKRCIERLKEWENVPLQKYREIENSELGKWINQKQKDYFREIKQALGKTWQANEYIEHPLYTFRKNAIIEKYLKTYFQDNYTMFIDYERQQTITFGKKEQEEYEEVYSILPPMLFCKAATVKSQKYICHAECECRIGITKDHPFIVWLFKNANQLNTYFKRQLERITDYLCRMDAEEIIVEWGKIHAQLLSLSNHYDIDMSSLPKLSMDDFWSE